MNDKITHNQLVKIAGRWLRNTIGCAVVLEEFNALIMSCETPDAIGWHGHRCILVECKTSRQDFFADLKKPARRPGTPYALGSFRFYLTPPDLIKESEIPEGWGLYEVHGQRVRHAGGVSFTNATAPPFQSDKNSEVGLLVSSLRRLKFNTAVYIREIKEGE